MRTNVCERIHSHKEEGISLICPVCYKIVPINSLKYIAHVSLPTEANNNVHFMINVPNIMKPSIHHTDLLTLTKDSPLAPFCTAPEHMHDPIKMIPISSRCAALISDLNRAGAYTTMVFDGMSNDADVKSANKGAATFSKVVQQTYDHAVITFFRKFTPGMIAELSDLEVRARDHMIEIMSEERNVKIDKNLLVILGCTPLFHIEEVPTHPDRMSIVTDIFTNSLDESDNRSEYSAVVPSILREFFINNPSEETATWLNENRDTYETMAEMLHDEKKKLKKAKKAAKRAPKAPAAE